MNKDNIIHVQKPEPTGEPLHVEAEEVKGPVEGTLDLGAPETIISMELKKFDVNKEAIAIRKAEFSALVIAGPEDKKGYEAVDTARKVMVKMRTGTEKARVDAKSKYKTIGEGIDDYAKELKTAILEVEEGLEKKLKDIDDAARIAEEKAAKEREDRFQGRKQQLLAAGMKYTGNGYEIDEGSETITLDEHALRLIEDEQFNDVLLKANDLNAAIVEAERQKELEAEQNKQALAKQQKELEDMKKERRELRGSKLKALGFEQIDAYNWVINNRAADDTLQAEDLAEMNTEVWAETLAKFERSSAAHATALKELEEKEAEEKRQQEEKEKQELAAKERFKLRSERLLTLGIKEMPNGFFLHGKYGDIVATKVLVMETPDENFDIVVENISRKIGEANELSLKIQQRKNQLELINFVIDGNLATFSCDGAEKTILLAGEEFQQDDAEWLATLEQVQAKVKEIEAESAENKRKEAEKKEEERKGLLSSAELAQEYLTNLLSVSVPEIESPLISSAVTDIRDAILATMKSIEQNLK